jgi:hypothetical protein
MVNPLEGLRIYQIAVVAFVAAGALAGLACGYHVSQWTWGGVFFWVIKRTDDAAGWATFGAIVAGLVVYGVLSMSAWSKRGRGTAGAMPGRSRRTQPPRADATSSTSSRRRKERTGGISLQQALQGTGSTSWRA